MPNSGYKRFFAELKRRRVFRVMAVYGAVAFLVLQVADIAFPGLGLPEWTITLVLALSLLGFPLVIVLAWAFEMTPDGVQRTSAAEAAEIEAILAAPASKRWPAGLLALGGVAALVAGAWYVGRQSAPAVGASAGSDPQHAVASIAVLPFVNMSDDESNEYFSDGISEELLNLLAKIPELQVAARTSSFSFKEQNLEITEIADRLNVEHVLEGSVRKSGDRVRITAQLIRAGDGFHLWSDSWDRTLEDIFAIQDEIAADVVDQLQITLLGAAPAARPIDPRAYALFLQGRHLARLNTAEGWERSIGLYQEALALEPEYAAAFAGLAFDYWRQTGRNLRPRDEGLRLAREAAKRALVMDPESADAYAVLARITTADDRDLAAGARYMEEALARDSTNPDILIAAAGLAQNLGRLDEAVKLLEYVAARDPVNPRAHQSLALHYLWSGRPDEALASANTALSLSPDNDGVHYTRAEALLMKDDPEAAFAAIQQEASEIWRLVGLPMVYHALGQQTEANAALANLIAELERDAAYNIAYVLAFMGENDRAFEWLDKAVEYDDPGLSEIVAEGMFANLHDDPRWLPFLASIGKSPDQLDAIQFRVRLPQ